MAFPRDLLLRDTFTDADGTFVEDHTPEQDVSGAGYTLYADRSGVPDSDITLEIQGDRLVRPSQTDTGRWIFGGVDIAQSTAYVQTIGYYENRAAMFTFYDPSSYEWQSVYIDLQTYRQINERVGGTVTTLLSNTDNTNSGRLLLVELWQYEDRTVLKIDDEFDTIDFYDQPTDSALIGNTVFGAGTLDKGSQNPAEYEQLLIRSLPSNFTKSQVPQGGDLIRSGSWADDMRNRENARTNDIETVSLSGTQYQITSYFTEGGYLALATRDDQGTGSWTSWTEYVYDGNDQPTTIQTSVVDNHNYAAAHFDSDGVVHFAYDMHGDSLLYRRSDASVDQWSGGVTTTQSLTGANEDRVTYPQFYRDPSGTLYFTYRNGGSGDGDTFLKVWDPSTQSWSGTSGAGADGMVYDGAAQSSGTSNLYPLGMAFDSDFGSGGHLHFFWTLRLDQDSTSFNIYYARWDGADWKDVDGNVLSMPLNGDSISSLKVIGQAQDEIIVSNTQPDSDSQGRPHVAYARTTGNHLEYQHLYYDGTGWQETQITNEGLVWSLKNKLAGTPQLLVDRDTDVAYVIARGLEVGGPVYAYSSSDYSTWQKQTLIDENVGRWDPRPDRKQWRDQKDLHMVGTPLRPDQKASETQVYSTIETLSVPSRTLDASLQGAPGTLNADLAPTVTIDAGLQGAAGTLNATVAPSVDVDASLQGAAGTLGADLSTGSTLTIDASLQGASGTLNASITEADVKRLATLNAKLTD